MRGGSGVSSITQSEAQWLDLRGFEDVITWLECKNVTLGGATTITLQYQTSPTKDESLFTGVLASPITLAAGTVTVSKVLLSAASVPLARWLRWQLAPTGTLTGSWDATFRVWVAANIGPHPLRPRIQAPPLRPNGKTCNGDCQKGGSTPISPMPPRAAGGPPRMVGARGSPVTTSPPLSTMRGSSAPIY